MAYGYWLGLQAACWQCWVKIGQTRVPGYPDLEAVKPGFTGLQNRPRVCIPYWALISLLSRSLQCLHSCVHLNTLSDRNRGLTRIIRGSDH